MLLRVSLIFNILKANDKSYILNNKNDELLANKIKIPSN